MPFRSSHLPLHKTPDDGERESCLSLFNRRQRLHTQSETLLVLHQKRQHLAPKSDQLASHRSLRRPEIDYSYAILPASSTKNQGQKLIRLPTEPGLSLVVWLVHVQRHTARNFARVPPVKRDGSRFACRSCDEESRRANLSPSAKQTAGRRNNTSSSTPAVHDSPSRSNRDPLSSPCIPTFPRAV